MVRTFWVFEVEDGIVVSEEVDLINSEWVRVHLFDQVLDDLVTAGLHRKRVTVVLLITLTLRRWLPLPPVRASPTFSLSLWMLAWISYCESSINGKSN